MPYYRKKPSLVEARQYTGDNFLELKKGDIIYSPYNLFRVKKVSQVTDSHTIVYYAPRFGKTTASTMCPNDEKFTRVIKVQE